jgi:hypothetical protein
MGAGIRNGCIGRFGNTRAEQVSPPRRTVARQHALSPGVVGLDRVAFVLGIVASVLWCIERSIRRGDQTRRNSRLVGRGDEDPPYEI